MPLEDGDGSCALTSQDTPNNAGKPPEAIRGKDRFPESFTGSVPRLTP